MCHHPFHKLLCSNRILMQNFERSLEELTSVSLRVFSFVSMYSSSKEKFHGFQFCVYLWPFLSFFSSSTYFYIIFDTFSKPLTYLLTLRYFLLETWKRAIPRLIWECVRFISAPHSTFSPTYLLAWYIHVRDCTV